MSQGRAARVREADPGIVVESFGTFLRRNLQSPLALLEVRRPLETEVAALAAIARDARTGRGTAGIQ